MSLVDMPATEMRPDASKVTQRTICLVVRKGRFGTKRRVSTEAVEVDSDKRLLRLSKTILESPELKAVASLDQQVSRYLRELSLPSMLKSGIFLIPLGLVEEVHAQLERFAAERRERVEAAVATYEQRCQETSARLNVLHDPRDYPSADRFRASFYLEWQFVTWETPTKLREIRPALFELEREKAARKLSAVADECRAALREGLKALVDQLVERLRPGPDGRPKRLSRSVVKHFEEFFRTFDAKNVTDDQALDAIVQQARAVLNGLDLDQVRQNESLREAMAQRVEAIQAHLEPLTAGRGDRAIDLDEDEEEDEV